MKKLPVLQKSSKTNILNLKFMILIFDEIMQGKLKTASDFNSASKRIAYLLNRLIETEDFLRMDDLSEEVGVSRGTVVKDLKTLKEMINDFDVKITGTPNKGLRIIGDELELRLLLFYFVSPYFSETKTEQFLEENKQSNIFRRRRMLVNKKSPF